MYESLIVEPNSGGTTADAPAAASPLDAALQAEGVSGGVADFARSLYQQESSSGANTQTSNARAVGGMQVIPSTFKSVADEGWDIHDPVHNARAGVRYAKQMYDRAGGDPALAAAGYYGGPVGMDKARQGIAVRDPRNPNAPDTLQYGREVAARISRQDAGPTKLVDTPAAGAYSSLIVDPVEQAQTTPTSFHPQQGEYASLIVPPPDTLGQSVSKGFGRGVEQSKALAGGMAALMARSFTGDDENEFAEKAMDYYRDRMKEAEKYSTGSTSFTDAAAGDGSLASWAAESAGYLGYQIVESIFTGGVGGFLGKQVGKKAVQVAATGMVEKEIARLAATDAAKTMSREQLANLAAANTARNMAAGTSIFLNNLRQEGGSIYPDAVDESAKSGQPVNLAKVWLASIAAAGVDTGADVMAAKGALGMREGSTAASYAGRAAREIPKAIAVQGGTEGVQTVIERAGAGQEILSPEGIKDIVDSTAVGAIGGVGAGAGAAAHRAHDAAAAPAVPPGLEPVADKAAEPNSPLSKAAMAGNTGPLADAARAAATGQAQAQQAAQTEQAGQQQAATSAFESRVQGVVSAVTPEALDALRVSEGAPAKASQVVHDLAIVKSQSTPMRAREEALNRLEFAMEWAGVNPAPSVASGVEQIVSGPTEGRGSPEVIADPYLPKLQAGAQRDMDLQEQKGAAGTAFEKQQVEAQADVNRQRNLGAVERAPRAPEVQAGIDLLAAVDRGGVPLHPVKLRHIAEGLGLEVSKNAQPAETISRIREAVRRAESAEPVAAPAPAPAAPLPDLSRLDAAAAAGQRRLPADRQQLVAIAHRNIEDRQGVAAPWEAQVLEEAGLGKPYDRVDESLSDRPLTDEAQTRLTTAAANSVNVVQKDRLKLDAAAAKGQKIAAKGDDTQQRLEAAKDLGDRRTAAHAGDIEIARSAERSQDEPAAAPAPQPAAQPARAGEGPAVFRKRRATLRQLIDMGMNRVERAGGAHILTDGKRSFVLEGPADAQLARREIAAKIREGAEQANTAPTEAEKKAGNYKKGRVEFDGLKLGIENPIGSTRSGTSPDGTTWSVEMSADYGDLTSTTGADGAGVDVYLAPNPRSGSPVFVFDQHNDDGSFDEHKAVLGAPTEEAAAKIYDAHFSDGSGPRRRRAVTKMTVDEFKAWANSPAAKKPADGGKYGESRRTDNSDAAARDGQRRDDAGAGVAGGSARAAGRDAGLGADDPSAGTDAGDGGSSTPVRGDARRYVKATVNGKRRTLPVVDISELATKSTQRPGGAKRITKEKAELIKAIAKIFGKEVVFFQDDEEGGMGDGFVLPNIDSAIFLNEFSTIHPLAVFGHELLHLMQREMPEAHHALRMVIRDRLKSAKGYRDDYFHADGQEHTNEPLNSDELEELTSDLGGDLLSDVSFWQEVMDQIQKDHPEEGKALVAHLAAKLYAIIEKLVAAFKALKQPDFRAQRHVDDMQSIRAAFRDAMAKYAAANHITKTAMQAEVLRQKQNDAKESKARDVTQTEAFQKWFGDSKVVDAAGKPLVVYHGTIHDFSDFDIARADMGAHFGTSEQANNVLSFWDAKKRFGQRVLPAYLSIKNPLRMRDLGSFMPRAVLPQLRKLGVIKKDAPDSGFVGNGAIGKQAIRDAIEAAGYDGVVYANTREGAGDSWMALRPEQIKSAIGNDGKFDPKSSDITRSAARDNDERDQTLESDTTGELGRGAREDAAQVPDYGTAGRPGAVSVLARHYSTQARKTLSSAAYGRGYKGGERGRVMEAEDKRLRDRVHFYVDQGKGVQPEAGVGSYAHEVRLNNVYDPNSGLIKGIKGETEQDRSNNFESAVVDRGFDGYLNPDFTTRQGAAVLLGKHDVPVKYIGMPANPQPQAEAAPETLKKGLLSREAREIDASKIPGAKLESGNLTIPTASSAAANAELERIGSPVRFSRARDVTETPEFQKWFGDSKVVDERGNPLVVLHGTRGDFSEFDQGRFASTDEGTSGAGIYATPDKDFANAYTVDARDNGDGGNVMPLYMSVKNPVAFDEAMRLKQQIIDEMVAKGTPELKAEAKSGRALTMRLMRMGYDGVEPGFDGAWVAFDPTQVKSALGNAGTFDANANDITQSKARITDDTSVYWHGSPSGDLRGGSTGLHLGTKLAATQALEARIGVPAEGEWDGTREYGKTLLAGRKTLARLHEERGYYLDTGLNAGAPEDDYYPTPGELKYADGTAIPMDAKPSVRPFRLNTEMTNKAWDPHDDFKANGYMSAQKKKGTARRGYYYKNIAEDEGSISVVVPDGSHVTRADDITQSKARETLRPEVVEAAGSAIRFLTPAERAKLRVDTATKLYDLFRDMPSANEMAAVAFAGKAKRGWYEQSAHALMHVFGPDAPRFAALLAALSPQTSVEINLRNALATWKNWTRAGRPVDKSEIFQIMGRSVEGNKLTESVLPAWVPNTVRALTAEDPESVVLSGPKVNSFMLNLRGVAEEVTNDAWMANYAAVDQRIFSGGLNAAGTDPGKGPGYMAMSAKVRQAARKLSDLTGEDWSPAEVQETVWSWAKTLYELQSKDVGARELLENEAVTDELIQSTPDFRTQLHEARNEETLREAGYGEEIDSLRGRGRDAGPRDQESGAGSQAAPFDRDAQGKLLRKAASRLEALRDTRAAAEAETRATSAHDDRSSEAHPPEEEIRQSAARGGRDEDGNLGGLPTKVTVPGVGEITVGHWAPAEKVARDYAAAAGVDYNPPTEYVKVDVERAARIAQAYEDMKHDPANPEVRAAFQAMADEVTAQYQAVMKTGLKVEFIDFAKQGDPYAASPRLATEDIRNNNHFWVFSTRDGYGTNEFDTAGNPMLAETDFEISGQKALVNDLFRVVHDYFGHAKEGVGFRADGEENAWRAHSAMFTPLARRAMTSETRGQNSWVNYGPHGEKNRKASGADTVYADQKTGLLPQWVVDEGAADAPKSNPSTRDADLVQLRKDESVLNRLLSCLAG